MNPSLWRLKLNVCILLGNIEPINLVTFDFNFTYHINILAVCDPYWSVCATGGYSVCINNLLVQTFVYTL